MPEITSVIIHRVNHLVDHTVPDARAPSFTGREELVTFCGRNVYTRGTYPAHESLKWCKACASLRETVTDHPNTQEVPAGAVFSKYAQETYNFYQRAKRRNKGN